MENKNIRKEFEKEMMEKYPNLYKDMYGDRRITCMAWGIDTGPGWYPLIRELSEKLEALIVAMPEANRPEYKAEQIKEKFGGLRFYLSAGTPEMFALIDKAGNQSYSICEKCSLPAKPLTDGGWVRTLCPSCHAINQEKRQQPKENDNERS